MNEETQQINRQDYQQPQIIQEDQQQKINQKQVEDKKMQAQQQGQTPPDKQYVDEVKIGGETLFTITPEMQNQSNNLVYRQRKTRWGERQIKRSKIQEDAIFNPLEALYSGNSLLPITQYGQAELDIKLSLYSDGKHRKSKQFKIYILDGITRFKKHLLRQCQIIFHQIQVQMRYNICQVSCVISVGLYRLDQLTAKINDFVPDDADIRSPSPQPIYDKDGRRINTRQIRKRDAFHRERIGLIEDCMKMRSSFVPPDDYKPLKKYKKIYLTETAINDSKANYIGRIIGPQGVTQKLIQKRSGCKIAVRGRGINKHEKNIFQSYQRLHIIVVADNDQDLDKGVKEIHNILNGEPDDQLQKQLKQLQGTIVLGKLDNYCDNCQQQGHRTWACPFQMNKNRANVKCSICGETSHPTSDCPQRQAYLKKQEKDKINMLLQSQYTQFKSDLNNDNKKNKEGLAFITDEKKDLLAIGVDKNKKVPEKKNNPSQKKQPQPITIFGGSSEDIPKFEDD